MKFTDLFIKRPVLASVISLLILLVGMISYFNIPLRQFPQIATTVMTVGTSYPGADAALMEGFVTTPLETALSAVNGVDVMTSNSTQGQSQITLQFKLNYDINTALADVNSAVASARWHLPSEVSDPVIEKQDPNAMPVIWIAFTSKTMDEQALTDYIQRVVQPSLQTIDGVSQAEIFGAREYAMRVWLNPEAMAAQGVTASDVQRALTANNLQMPTGQIKSQFSQFAIQANTSLSRAKQFNALVLANPTHGPGHMVRVQDVGHAQLGVKDDSLSAYMDGQKTIFLGVVVKSTGNPLAVVPAVTQMLNQMRQHFPVGVEARPVWDNSKFIAQSIHEVKRTIFEAILVVVLIIFLFLGSLRTLIITVISIPLSLVGAFAIIAVCGFTINTLTLLALVLAIGMVVDDVIVVSENIHRHLEQGKSALAAALLGAREIQFAVIAMTFTLAAVFAPIGFMTGITGILFREFAFTLAGAVMISGLVALTLSPMLCSKLLRPIASHGRLTSHIFFITQYFEAYYRQWLQYVMHKRRWIVGLMILVLIAISGLYRHIPKELAPQEDEGALMAIMTAPPNANIHYTEQSSQAVGKILATVPEVTEYGIVNGMPKGVTSAIAFAALKPWAQRQRSVDQIVTSLFPQFLSLPGIVAFPFNPYALPGATGLMPVDFVLETTGSYRQLADIMSQLVNLARQNPHLLNVDTDLKFDKKRVKIAIDRDRAAALGVSMESIGSLLNIAFGETAASQFNMNGRSYSVIPQLAARFRDQADDITNLNVRTATGQLVPLSNIATLSMGMSPRSLNHFQQLRATSLTASLAPGYTMGEALAYLEKAAHSIMPNGMKYDFSGESRQFVHASRAMERTFVFALLFIFLALSAQFESFRSPLVVMFTVPLSTLGALILLKLTGSTINIYTQIGMVTLVGLISKHGILMTEFANQLQEKGYSRQVAIVEAAVIRLRPIIMTTLAMALGALPLVSAVGAGAVSRRQMGLTIIGGMLIGTLFTLFVIPVIYTWLAAVKKTPANVEHELVDVTGQRPGHHFPDHHSTIA